MRLPWASAGFAIALGTCCAAELTGDTAGYGLAAAVFALGLAVGWRSWLLRPSGKVAGILAGATVLLATLFGVEPMALGNSVARMSDVVVLMLCVALMRPIFAERQLDEVLAALLQRVRAPLRLPIVLIAACAASLGLSFGVVAIFGASFGGRTAPGYVAPYATMRGLVLSMLLGPSTASVAAVIALYPDVSWEAALLPGVPLVAAGALLGSVGRERLVVQGVGAGSRGGGYLILIILLAEFAIAFIAHAMLALSMALAISVASAAVAVGCRVWWGSTNLRRALYGVDAQMAETWRRIMPEAALFLASGLLIGLMESPALADGAKTVAFATIPSGAWGVATILVAIPLITVAGIHPIVPFALLSPSLSPAILGINDVGLYTMWVVAFMLSMLLSPVSVLTMITISNFGIPARLLGLRGHGLYAIGLALMSTAAIILLCPR